MTSGTAPALEHPSIDPGVVVGDDGLARPAWASTDPMLRRYYDTEWGMPVRDERGMYERISLEGFQAALSWATILRKRPAFRAAFDGFDFDRVACYGDGDGDVDRLMADPGIVRNRAKILASVTNARATVRLRGRGCLAAFVWRFTPPDTRRPRTFAETPHGIPRVAGSVQGSARGRVRVRRPDHHVRAHGSHRHRRHPPDGLAPPRLLPNLAGMTPAGLLIDPAGPFDHDVALATLAAHRIEGLHAIDPARAVLQRWMDIGGHPVAVTAHIQPAGVAVRTHSGSRALDQVVHARVGRWFDLDADIAAVDAAPAPGCGPRA